MSRPARSPLFLSLFPMRTRVRNNLAVACAVCFAPMAGDYVRNGNGALRANINADHLHFKRTAARRTAAAEIFNRAKKALVGRTYTTREEKRKGEKEREGERKSPSTLFSAYLHIHVISRD